MCVRNRIRMPENPPAGQAAQPAAGEGSSATQAQPAAGEGSSPGSPGAESSASLNAAAAESSPAATAAAGDSRKDAPPQPDADQATAARLTESDVERRVQAALAADRKRRDREDHDRLERLADERVAAALAKVEAAREAARLEAALDADDTAALADAKRRELMAERHRREVAAQQPPAGAAMPAQLQELRTTVWREADTVLHSMLDALPPDGKTAILGKLQEGKYGEDPVDARRAFFRDTLEAFADSQVKAARAKWEKDELPGAVTERLGERAAGEPALDKDAGKQTGTGALTLEQWQNMTLEGRARLRREQPGILAALMRTATYGAPS